MNALPHDYKGIYWTIHFEHKRWVLTEWCQQPNSYFALGTHEGDFFFKHYAIQEMERRKKERDIPKEKVKYEYYW